GNVDEYVRSAIGRLNEAKTLLRIEKLDFTPSHIRSPLKRRSASKSRAPSRRLRPTSTLSSEEPQGANNKTGKTRTRAYIYNGQVQNQSGVQRRSNGIQAKLRQRPG